MMDTVYGTKKYFQSLSGGSDIYRTSASRAMANEYTSYQNTLGRRSAVGPYTHMGKFPSYSTDISSQYGYNTWGVWRDNRNISPSTYSSKSRQSVRSFSIILMTAAFIVILAVLSIAGLAFYFSSFKSNLDDPIMAFEGHFRVMKGDMYTTGLKYNHTSTFRQKSDFYKRFVERSLQDNDLQPTKSDILGFGDGPLINVHFRVFLDMQHVPQAIRSVEDHIRDSIFLETNSLKSLYKSIRIEPDSVDVKRIMDQEFLKSASFIRDSPPSASQTHFEERLNKKSGMIDKPTSKLLTTQKPKLKVNDGEPEVDVENAPVIQGSFEGSFEITKTDADITHRRTSPTKSLTTKSSLPAVKSKPQKIAITENTKPTSSVIETTTNSITTHKITTQSLAQTSATSSSSTSKAPTKTTTTPTTTTTTTTSTAATTKPAMEQPSRTTTTTAGAETNKSSSSVFYSAEESPKYYDKYDPPKLDASLFTSSPVLDTEPWRPIRPPGTTSDNLPNLPENLKPAFNNPSQSGLEAIESGLLPRNKLQFSEQVTQNPNDMIFYHSFTNPVFMPGTAGIERLGNSDVRPHPLPVPLLDDIVIPEFKPIRHEAPVYEHLSPETEPQQDKFEHIGGGVIVMNHEENEKNHSATNITEAKDELLQVERIATNDTILSSGLENSTQAILNQLTNNSSEQTSSPLPNDSLKPEIHTQEELSTELSKIGELLYDLLELPKENDSQSYQMESRIESDPIEKPNFLNIREHILNKNKPLEIIPKPKDEQRATTTTKKPVPSTTPSTATTRKRKPKPTSNKRIRVTSKPTTANTLSPTKEPVKSISATIDQSMLFPANTKWEYVNGSSSSHSLSAGATKKVFNETLQAWIVENSEKPENISIRGNANTKRNNTQELQNISLIFDTLASKLGISPSLPTKIPPFNAFSQNKFKQALAIDDDTNRRDTTGTSTSSRQKPTLQKSTTPLTSTTESILPLLVTALSSESPFIESMSPDAIIGEAEVEVVDPTKYEEMLSSQATSSTTTTRTPSLVTLLPVRSNSGIRTFRPPVAESRRFGSAPRYREAIVKTGIQVTV